MESITSSQSNYSLVILKPDACKAEIWGEILHAFANWGLKIFLSKMIIMSDEQIDKHYEAHLEKDFYPALKAFMKSGPSMVILSYGDWQGTRWLAEHIRKKYNVTNPANLIHASDSLEAAKREIELWYPGTLKNDN